MRNGRIILGHVRWGSGPRDRKPEQGRARLWSEAAGPFRRSYEMNLASMLAEDATEYWMENMREDKKFLDERHAERFGKKG